MAQVVQILTAPTPTARAQPQQSVRAVPGRGLEGDRYFFGCGTFSPNPSKADFELTLIEEECVEKFARESGVPFDSRDARRNIVTRGIALNGLVGREFSIGQVRIRGIRLCEPCNHLAKHTHAAVLRGLVHQGGLRAQILTEGTVFVGDAIVET